MRETYLKSGIRYLNRFCSEEIDDSIVNLIGRDFETELLKYFPACKEIIKSRRLEFLSSKKASKFGSTNNEHIFVALRSVLVSSYLLKSEKLLNANDRKYLPFFTDGLVKVQTKIGSQENKKIAEIIESAGSKVFKKKQSLAKNFDELAHVCKVIESEVGDLIRGLFTVSKKNTIRQFRDNSFLQITPVSPKHLNNDHQSDLHMDTFFPALKWWYFPRDVTPADGPFLYLNGSPAPRKELYEFIEKSLISTAMPSSLNERSIESHNEGSFRGEVNIAEQIFNSNLKPVSCSAGSLVIGNVMGLHARGYSDIPKNRLALHGSFRSTKHDELHLKSIIRNLLV